MACIRTQSTLPSADRDLAHYAQSLGWLRLASWLALEQSTSIHSPLSTGAALTQRLVGDLVDVGVVAVDGAGTRRALYEPLAWRYTFEVGEPTRLVLLLSTALAELSADREVQESQCELWEVLAEAELETYLSHLLRRHSLDGSQAIAIARAMGEEWAGLSLARRRYLVWTGIRGAAAALLRTNLDHDAAYAAMLEEMRRRCRWLLTKVAAGALPAQEYCFMPEVHWKRPILVDVLVSAALPDAATYWTVVPARAALTEGAK